MRFHPNTAILNFLSVFVKVTISTAHEFVGFLLSIVAKVMAIL